MTTEYQDGYRAGVEEGRNTSPEAARAFVTQCPARNEWERGHARGLLEASGAEPVQDLTVALAVG